MKIIRTLEEFSEMLNEVAGEMPQEFFRELNGGIILKPERKLHPESRGEELCILGEYHRDKYLGRYIVIYYGSFVQICGNLPEDALSARLRKTVLHEFRHHLESLAGEKDLEVEDAVRIARYKKIGPGKELR